MIISLLKSAKIHILNIKALNIHILTNLIKLRLYVI